MGTGPTLAGFQTFITSVMGVPNSVLAPTAPVVGYAFGFAQQWVNQNLSAVPGVPGVWSIYEMATYNLAADTLINWAPDTLQGSTYWADLRTSFGVNNFVAGVISASSDVTTSESLEVPEAFKALTIANLGNLKTPYGRTYLGLAQSWGTTWGLS